RASKYLHTTYISTYSLSEPSPHCPPQGSREGQTARSPRGFLPVWESGSLGLWDSEFGINNIKGKAPRRQGRKKSLSLSQAARKKSLSLSQPARKKRRLE
ncbi:hypothetical protein SARC_14319, partial [Sphaeroforma arctica JP610]